MPLTPPPPTPATTWHYFFFQVRCFLTTPPKAVTISGAPVRGHADFPVEAVQSFHEKPLPTHDSRPAHSSKPQQIHQPRKQ
ncbi:hypothetical protein J6590_031072 [Homalodisca vitripennis]|nr:hypothetical protein J6590_031072 [Homalodisca vitripennis]